MLLVNFWRLLSLLEDFFCENKAMEPIVCLVFICLQDNIVEQRLTFFAKGQKPAALGVPCERRVFLKTGVPKMQLHPKKG